MHWNTLVAYLVFAALFWQFEITNSRTSTLWRLNPSNGKITTGNDAGHVEEPFTKSNTASATIERNAELLSMPADIYTNDQIFYIITSTLNEGGGGHTGWIRQSPEEFFDQPEAETPSNVTTVTMQRREKPTMKTRVDNAALVLEERLNCGKPINFSIIDQHFKIDSRYFYQIPIPEPEVAYLFLNSNDAYAFRNFDILALEQRLKRAKNSMKEETPSFELYMEITNYFRIIGDARQAIECLRRAAQVREHPDVFTTLARILYNLNCLHDAMAVSLESIKRAPTGYVPWQEYFILGEIFKAKGHNQESSMHLRHALDLYPHHEPILKVLRDVENSVLSSLHVYTLLIIIALVVAVFVVIISSTVISSDSCASNGYNNIASYCTPSQFDGESIPKRHFNRALAMRSLKGFSSSSRHIKHRKF